MADRKHEQCEEWYLAESRYGQDQWTFNMDSLSCTPQRLPPLPEEFFYALFTFTDIRNFVEALESKGES